MNSILAASLSRIAVVFELTLKEAMRRRLILVLVLGCVLFMGSGAGCLRACRGLMNQSIEGQEADFKRRLMREGRSAAEIDSQLGQARQQLQEAEKATKRQLKVALLGFSFGLIAFWLYMIAGVFTPFLAMNDFQNRTHVMILARPVTREEYLLGKYCAIVGLLLLNAALLFASFHAFMFLSIGEAGWEVWRGVPIFLEGLALFVALMMFLTLLVGRIPAIFIGISLIAVGIVPAMYVMTSPEKIGEGIQQVLVYGMVYGTPQFSVNFLYGLSEVLDLPGIEDNFLKQAGNKTGLYSLFINAGWLIAVAASLVALFRRREVET
ncbi:MAG: ABC transporter permease subunit [Spirochaetia bacterium]|nr:ABC transporter permease subunit [Spirochaetia bacterium]